MSWSTKCPDWQRILSGSPHLIDTLPPPIHFSYWLVHRFLVLPVIFLWWCTVADDFRYSQVIRSLNLACPNVEVANWIIRVLDFDLSYTITDKWWKSMCSSVWENAIM